MLPLLVEIKKTTTAAKEIASLRSDAKVLGIGNIDVRKVQNLKEAVDKTVEELGRIDFVIAGAAGNFLCDFNHLSSNAFKSIVDIDLLDLLIPLKLLLNNYVKQGSHFIC